MGWRMQACALLVLLPCVFSSPIYDILAREKRQTADNECNQADIVFVLDSSGSIKAENWLKVLNFTKTVVQSLDIGPYDIRVGCITYGTKATPNFYLDTYDNKADILNAIDLIPWKDQETNTSGALWFMRDKLFSFDKGDRIRAPNLAIVMTDGESNRDQHLTIPIANEIKSEGRITMFAIGVGNKTNINELRAIATNSSYVFSVTEFGMLPQINNQIVSAACDIPVECHQSADITFIMDSSGSVRSENFEKMKTFIGSLVDLINVEGNQTNVGLITFSDSAKVEFQLDAYHTRSEIKNAVMAVKYARGTTNSAAALRLAREQVFLQNRGDRPNMKNIIIFFTDGNSNNFQLTIEEAQRARNAGITIIAVAVTTWIQMDEIREIATDPDELNVFQVKNFDEVIKVKQNLKEILCDQINECDSKPCKNGGVCVNGINTYECICPTGTAGVHCEISCSPVDVVMAIDSSGSIGRSNYYKVLDFAKDFANSLNFQSGNAQMGVEVFSNNNEIKFQLNTHNSKQGVANAISFPYSGGTTNTAAALQAMRDVMFTSSNGNRGGVRKVGITVTDGESNDRDLTYKQATLARDNGITMLSVAINIKSKQGQQELLGIASDPDDKNVMNVANFESLKNITDSLILAVCNTNNECEPNPCHSTAQCIDMVNGYRCVCPIGRSGKHCERTCDGRADIAFVVDASGSIRETRFQIVRNYVKSIVNEMEIAPDKVRVSLIQFSDEAKVLFHLNQFSRKEDVLQSIEWMPYTRGRTYTADALKKLYSEVFISSNGDRASVPNYAVLITDGESTVKPEDTLPEAIQARIHGIHLIAVAVGDRRNSLEIKGIASDPDSFNIYSVENFNQLATKSMPLVNGMCDTVDECANNPCQNGGNCLNGLGQYVCRCRDEFTGQNCERGCTKRSDIVFVLDASGSVEINFEMALNLTRKIVKGLNFAGDRTRVGIITYSDNALIRFNLNTHKLLIEVENAIAFTLMGGRTNTYSGLNEMRRNMFTAAMGDRSGVTNYGIVITDGRSNINELNTVPEADLAKRDNINIFAVGIGENGKVDRSEINGIASNPDSDYAYIMQNENDLEGIANNILNKICQ